MKNAVRTRPPEVLYRNGKPKAVQIDIQVYEKMLERLEDQADLEYIRKLKARNEKFVPLNDLLDEFK